MRLAIMLLQVFFVTLLTASQFNNSFGVPMRKINFLLPQEMVDSERPASQGIVDGLKSLTENELQVATHSMPENEDLKKMFIEFKIMTKKMSSFYLHPILVYEYLDNRQNTLIQGMFPNENATIVKVYYDPEENAWMEKSRTLHFTKVHLDTTESNDYRKSYRTQLGFTMECIKERFDVGRLNKEVFDFFKACADLQYLCMEEAVDFDSDCEIYDEALCYLELALIMFPVFQPKHGTYDEAIDEIIRLYDSDLKKLAESGLDGDPPKTLSKDFVLLFAENSLLKTDHILAHHDMCILARQKVFQTKLEIPMVGYYTKMKLKLKLCGIEETFSLQYPTLVQRLDDINCTTDYYSGDFAKAWNPKAGLAQKKSIIIMYHSMGFASDIMDFAVNAFDDGEINHAIQYAYHALVVMLTGLHSTAQMMLSQAVVNMLHSRTTIPKDYTEAQYQNFKDILEMYENNFAIIGHSYGGLADGVFNCIEVCRTLNFTLLKEVQGGVQVNMGQYDLYKVGVELVHFLGYIAEPIEKQGMLTDFKSINGIMQDAIITFRCVTEEDELGDNASMILKNYLVEVGTWRFTTPKPDIMKQIQDPYKNEAKRRTTFSLESILKRTKEAEAKKKLEAKKPKVVKSDPKPVKQVQKKQVNAQKPKNKKPKKRSSGELMRKPVEVNPELESHVAEDLMQVDPFNIELKTETVEVPVEVRQDIPEATKQPVADIKGSSSDDFDSKPTKRWQNAASTLFNDNAVVPVKEKEPVFPPTHISSITDHLGYSKVKADPRDIAMALLIIGERIWRKHLEPLVESLKAQDLSQLVSLFHLSLDKFEQEMNLLRFEAPDLYNELLAKAVIKDVDHFALCLKYYKQRVAVAHPHIPRLLNLKKSTALRHFTVLEKDGRTHPSILGSWRSRIEADGRILVTPISTENRPKSLLDCHQTEYVLAFISLHEFFGAEPSLSERNNLAHRLVKNRVFSAYVDYIFTDHTDREFFLTLL